MSYIINYGVNHMSVECNVIEKQIVYRSVHLIMKLHYSSHDTTIMLIQSGYDLKAHKCWQQIQSL